jgi:hypothetical protein
MGCEFLSHGERIIMTISEGQSKKDPLLTNLGEAVGAEVEDNN